MYIRGLVKLNTGSSLQQQALKNVENIKDFSFDGFISGFENTDTIVEVLYESDNASAGKITAHNKEVLVLDEYYAQNDQGLVRSYISRETITRISVDIPYLRIIARFLV